jgi:hypothetical protein
MELTLFRDDNVKIKKLPAGHSRSGGRGPFRHPAGRFGHSTTTTTHWLKYKRNVKTKTKNLTEAYKLESRREGEIYYI